MNAAGLEFHSLAENMRPATNGLNGPHPNFTFYDKEPVDFNQSTEHS
jgi:hypothetical protein